MPQREPYYRPFELMKLIKDKRITNMKSFYDDFSDMVPHSNLSYLLTRVTGCQIGLEESGLIQLDKKSDVISTENLTKFFRHTDISLRLLSNFSSNSIVSTPLFGVPVEPSVKSDIFVVMPFLKNLQPVYNDHIKNVAKKMNLTATRGDDFFTAGSIISDIWNAINACDIIIADCTGKNPNVFYEIGMAHTLGKTVILISQNKDDIPFDIQHIRYIVYEFTPRGMLEFEDRLQSTIGNEINQIFSYERQLNKKNAR